MEFEKAFHVLWANKRIIFITCLLYIIMVPMQLAFTYYSGQAKGMKDIQGKDIHEAQAIFERMNVDMFEFTRENLIIISIGIAVMIISSIVISYFVMRECQKALHKESKDQGILGIFLLFLLLFAIMFVPISLIAVIVVPLSIFVPLLGVFLGILLMIAYLVFLIYLMLKIIFIMPIFFSGLSPMATIKTAMKVKLGESFPVALVVIAILLISALILNYASSYFTDMIFFGGAKAIGVIGIAVIYLGYSFISSFVTTFIFTSYKPQ